MFLGLDIKTWLGLSVIGAVVSTIGSLIGIALKDYVFSRSFENWKQRRTLEQIYQHFKDPLLLSARELASRIIEILDQYPTVYLKRPVFESHPEKQIENSIDDPYFQRYKLISTLYRFCAFLGWLELYRQEIVFLQSGNNKHSKKLEHSIGKIRADLADGQLNKAEDWIEWRDILIFREELRAIGEAMIESHGTLRTIMGYGRFCELLESESVSGAKRWVEVVMNFFLDMSVHQRDFRRNRLQRLLVHLVDLLRLLDTNTLEQYLINAHNKWKSDVLL